MNVKIIFLNNIPCDSRLFVDGKERLLKKDKRGVSEMIAETDKPAEICVMNPSEAQLPFFKWFLYTFVCWLLSGFGIFDSVKNKQGRASDVRLTVKPAENAFVKLKFNVYKKDGRAVEITETNTETEETANRYYVDAKVKKRNKLYKIWRVLSGIAVAVAVVAIIVARS